MKNVKSERGIFEARITEEMVIKEIVARLAYAGARAHRIVERIPWGRTTSTPGLPDLWCYFYRLPVAHPGLILPIQFWIETKRPGGKRRPSQIAWIEAAQRDGVIAFFAESWADVHRELAARGIEVPA